MLDLYAGICGGAKLLLVCAPFELHHKLRDNFVNRPPGTLHYLLLDKPGSLGSKEEINEDVMKRMAESLATGK